MKRFTTLAAVLMTLVMVLSLAACGEETTPTDTTDTDTQSQSETTDPQQTTDSVDLAALRDQMIADYD